MQSPSDELVHAFWRHYLLESASSSQYPLEPAIEAAIDSIGRDPVGKAPAWAENVWAAREVDQVVAEGGPEAVVLLRLLAAAAPSEQSLGYLGGGALEDLITLHGLALADELDAALDQEPQLRTALSYVQVGVERLDVTTRFRDFYGLR